MLKNYICFTAAFIVFVFSIFVIQTYESYNQFVVPASLGGLIIALLMNSGLNKMDFDERKYKKIIREKNKEIKTQTILHHHAAQAADDFFKQIQALKNDHT